MDTLAYFRSLSLELTSQRDRVRQLIGGRHWPTDGHWKESVLRAVLRRTVGGAAHVGSGFVVAGEQSSTQVDLLLYRRSSPVLFRDGDLVIVPVEGVRGLIEVKSCLTHRNLEPALLALTRLCGLLQPHRRNVLVGLFTFDTKVSNAAVLRALREHCSEWPNQIDLLCHGPNRLVRYWHTRPGTNAVYEQWHSYDMTDLAFGYFTHNFVSHLLPRGYRRSGPPLYPRDGKERHQDGAVYRRGSLIEALENLRTD